MRKTFLSLLCLVMGCCALAGCSDNSQPFEEKSYTPDTQVREIQLDVEDRSIEVVLSPDNQVHIQYFENSKEYYQISVSDENVLTMTSASDKAWTDYIGGKPAAEDRRIRLEIPDGLLENVTLSTTNENITLPALAVTGEISLSSNGGNLSFESLDVGRALTLHAKNGNITGTVAGSFEDFTIRSKIKKGESNLPDEKSGGERTLDISCNNGDVSIAFAP